MLSLSVAPIFETFVPDKSKDKRYNGRKRMVPSEQNLKIQFKTFKFVWGTFIIQI